MTIGYIITVELFVSIMIGTIPSFIIFSESGYNRMLDALNNTVPSDTNILYSICLLCLHLIIWINKKRIANHFNPAVGGNKKNAVVDIISYTSSSLHSIYRLVLGTIICAYCVSIYLYYSESGALNVSIISLITGGACLLMCVLLSLFSNTCKISNQ